MEMTVCSECGASMPAIEVINGVEKDWTKETPICAFCRGEPGAKPLVRKRDVLGGMPWKRGEDGKTKVPR